MMHRDADRFRLAIDAVTAVFTLVARHTVSSGTMEIIDMHRRLRTLQAGGEDLIRLTLQSLNALAAAPQLFAFRLLTTALAQSLPRTCSAGARPQDIQTAALDLKRLAHEAHSLRAPDVALTLTRIIDAMFEQAGMTRQSATKDTLH